jgi:hypothetical protein
MPTVIADPPPYIVDVLGRRPDEPSRGRACDRDARIIEGYRQAQGPGIARGAPGLGARPAGATARVQYQAAQRALDRATAELLRGTVRERSGPDVGPGR